MVMLSISQITRNPRLQMRVAQDERIVEEYRDVYIEHPTGKMPPVRVVHDVATDTYWLADGFHRVEGADEAGLTEIEAEITPGDYHAAYDIALVCNRNHGHRSSKEDVDLALRRTLEDYPDLSYRAIAEKLGLSHTTVANYARKLEAAGAAQQAQPQQPLANIASGGNGQVGATGADTDVPEEGSLANIASGNGQASKESAAPQPRIKTDRNGRQMNTANIGKGKKKDGATDGWGIPIQEHAREAFAQAHKFDELVSKLKECAQLLSDLVDLPAGAHLMKRAQWLRSGNKAGGRWIIPNLENVIGTLQQTKPTLTDCPYAHNSDRTHDNCPDCYNLRWISSPKLHQFPPELIEAMKEHYGVLEAEKATTAELAQTR